MSYRIQQKYVNKHYLTQSREIFLCPFLKKEIENTINMHLKCYMQISHDFRPFSREIREPRTYIELRARKSFQRGNGQLQLQVSSSMSTEADVGIASFYF